MWCQWCSAHNANTKWNLNREYNSKASQKKVRGIQRFKIDSIRDHALSDVHKGSMEKKLQLQTMTKQVNNIFEKSYNDFKKLVSIVLFFCKEKLASAKYPAFCRFIKDLGIKLTDDNLYHSRYGFMEIVKSANEIIWNKQVEKIKEAKFFSVIIDESTDICSQKELIVYVKYFDNKAHKVQTQFLKLIKLQSSTASAITKEIQGLFIN